MWDGERIWIVSQEEREGKRKEERACGAVSQGFSNR